MISKMSDNIVKTKHVLQTVPKHVLQTVPKHFKPTRFARYNYIRIKKSKPRIVQFAILNNSSIYIVDLANSVSADNEHNIITFNYLHHMQHYLTSCLITWTIFNMFTFFDTHSNKIDVK